MLKALRESNTRLGTAIAVDSVSVIYPNGHQALNDVQFSLRFGTICGLVGVNGSGKSTLFKAIMGLLNPTRGSVRIGGLPVAQALKRQMVGLCAAGRGGRLELSGGCRGRRHDGPLRAHGPPPHRLAH